ncbi:MAG TPA: DNA topoisomerase III [Pseudogracilibacillus sp.]|nr:DNA topoisomerase III [Pseudogracilibacillus sp.]
MGQTLVLAEKPSVGRDLARVLGCKKKGNGFFEGKQYVVTWALGHLVTLATPEMYDQQYQEWRMDQLPMLPSTLKTMVIPKTKKQFNIIKTQLKRDDVTEVVIATDAGREGELVARWILDKAQVKKPIKRLWISSVTDKAIRDGFKKLQPGKKYENLYASAVARSEADWYVGLNATRALTTKFNASLSAGRVQTPTLDILQKREAAIRHFQPQIYQELHIQSSHGLELIWKGKDNQTGIFNKDRANQLQQKLKGKSAVIQQVIRKQKKQYSPALYDLTELQREANKRYGFSGKQTLRAMQQLYERHKVLSYPRTDARVITTDIVPTLKERIKASASGEWKTVANQLMKKTFHLPKSVVNDQQVSDHHAIIPTEEPAQIDQFDNQERKIYEMVVKRFLAVLSDPYEYEETLITAEVAGERFTKKMHKTNKLGWKALEGDKQAETELEVKEGQTFPFKSKLIEKETTPPERFTEGSLLKAMENPGKYLEQNEKHAAKKLQEVGGIGTVATRADIIDKLMNSQYMELRGKYLYVTSTGKQVLELAPEDLRSPALTAEWEDKLVQIEKGQLKKEQFIADIQNYTKKLVHEIKEMEATFKHDNLTGSKCPECGSLMLEIENRHGKMLRCKDRSCHYKKNIYKLTNARCPNCKKKMKLFGEGEGKTFHCVCGHSEKMATFDKRKKQQQQHKVSKKDVHKYMNKQEEFSNNALAEQLKKLQK